MIGELLLCLCVFYIGIWCICMRWIENIYIELDEWIHQTEHNRSTVKYTSINIQNKIKGLNWKLVTQNKRNAAAAVFFSSSSTSFFFFSFVVRLLRTKTTTFAISTQPSQTTVKQTEIYTHTVVMMITLAYIDEGIGILLLKKQQQIPLILPKSLFLSQKYIWQQ